MPTRAPDFMLMLLRKPDATPMPTSTNAQSTERRMPKRSIAIRPRCMAKPSRASCNAGSITAWRPPAFFSFEWRATNFAPGESTRVEVTFEAVPTGTRVTVVHAGWAALRDDHPVRHGQPSAAFLRAKGLWWGDLLTALREHTQ